MAEYTPNYSLKKPTEDEFYNVADQNDNMDKIDTALKTQADELAAKETPTGAQSKADTAESNAKAYTDQEVANVENDLNAHKAETASKDNPHNLVNTSVKVYYIDQANGNDNNNGATPSTAFKSWEEVQKKIPRFIDMPIIIIIIGNYTGNIFIKNRLFSGGGRTEIRGDTKIADNNVINGKITISSCFGGYYDHVNGYAALNITNLTISQGVEIYCADINIDYCKIHKPEGVGIFVGTSRASILNCDFGDSQVQDCIKARYNSKVISVDNIGTSTNYGLYSLDNSSIGKRGTQPTGATANEAASYGGVIR